MTVHKNQSHKVFLVDDYCDIPGGAEEQMYREADFLEEAGYTTVSVGFKRPAEDRGAVADYVIEESDSRLIRIAEKITVHPGIYAGLQNLLKQEDPDIVHLHKNINYPVTVLLACRNYPIIKTHHDFTNICPSGWAVYQDSREICPGGPGLKCIRHNCKSIAEIGGYHAPRYALKMPLQKKLIDAHIAPSRKLTEYLNRFNYDTRQIPYPAFQNTVPPSTEPGSETFLFVGRLTEEKGPAILLQAVAELHPKLRSDFELPLIRVAGDGPMKEELEKMSEDLGISDLVEFLGYVSHNRLTDFYLNSRAVVVPSIWMENFPNTVIEALSLGRPVIGSNRGGIPELIGEGKRGAIFDPRHHSNLADLLEEFLTQPDKIPEMSREALRYVDSELDEDDIRNQHISLIEKILAD